MSDQRLGSNGYPRPTPEYEAKANKKYLDAEPGRREAKNERHRELGSASQAAQRRLAKMYPNVFRRLYEEEAAKRGTTIGPRGRPKASTS